MKLTTSINELTSKVVSNEDRLSKINPLIDSIEKLITLLSTKSKHSGDVLPVNDPLRGVIDDLQKRMAELEKIKRPSENNNFASMISKINQELISLVPKKSIDDIITSLGTINTTLSTLQTSQKGINEQNNRLDQIINNIEIIVKQIPTSNGNTNTSGTQTISSATEEKLQREINTLKSDLASMKQEGLSDKYAEIMRLLNSIDSKNHDDIEDKLRTIIKELIPDNPLPPNPDIARLIESIQGLIHHLPTRNDPQPNIIQNDGTPNDGRQNDGTPNDVKPDLYVLIRQLQKEVEILKEKENPSGNTTLDKGEFNKKLDSILSILAGLSKKKESPTDLRRILEDLLKEIKPIELSEADKTLITDHTTAITKLISTNPNQIDDTTIKELLEHFIKLELLLNSSNGPINYMSEIQDIKETLQKILRSEMPTFNTREIISMLEKMESNVKDSLKGCNLSYTEYIDIMKTAIQQLDPANEFNDILSLFETTENSDENKTKISEKMNDKLLTNLKDKYEPPSESETNDTEKKKLWHDINCAFMTLKQSNSKQSETNIREIINNISNNPENLKGDIASLKNELEKWKNEIIESKVKESVDNAAIQVENEVLLEQSNRILRDHNANIEELKRLIGNLNTRLHEMTTEINTIKLQLREKDKELQTKTLEIIGLKKEKEDLQKQLEEAKREVNRYKEIINNDDKHDGKHDGKNDEGNSELKEKLKKAEVDLLETQKKLTICEDKLKDQTIDPSSQNEEKMKKCKDLEEELRNLQHQIITEKQTRILSYDTRIDFPLFHIIVMFKKTIDLILLNPNNIKVDKDETDENEDKNTMIYKLKKIDDTFINKLELDSKLLEELSEFEKIKIPTIFSLQERMKLLICALLHVSPMERYKIIKKDIIENTPSKISNIKNFGRVYIHEMKEYEKYFGYKPNENINSKQKNYFANYLVGLNDMINIGIDILNEYYREMVSPQLLEEQIKTVVNYRISDEFIERLQKSGFSSKEQIRLCIIYILQNEYLSN